MKRLHSFVAVGIAFFLPAALLAWGPEGHEVVAALAESLLSETAKSGVRSVIGDSTLASVSNWADQVRSQRDETYNWHFVDIPKSAAGFSQNRDCFLPTNNHAGAATCIQRIGTQSDMDAKFYCLHRRCCRFYNHRRTIGYGQNSYPECQF